MNLQSVTLPQDLDVSNYSELQIVDYHVARESTKQQVNLSMNTFSFLMKGHKEVFTDTTSVSISNTNFLVMKAGNCLMTEKLASTTDDYRSMLLFFSNETLLGFLRKHTVTIQEQTQKKSVHALPYDHFVHSFVQSLIELNKLDSHIQQELLPIKFEELMLYLATTKGTEFFSSLLSDIDDHSFHFRQVIENNKFNRLTLSELAFLSNMSLSTFKREFEKHFGETPGKWFQERRLEYAAFLLKNESKRPSDIYEEVGYDSLSNFIHAFKVKFGTTPKQY